MHLLAVPLKEVYQDSVKYIASSPQGVRNLFSPSASVHLLVVPLKEGVPGFGDIALNPLSAHGCLVDIPGDKLPNYLYRAP